MKTKHEDKSGGTQSKRIDRREFLGTSAKAAAAGAAITAFPAIVRAADPIRSIGLGVSIINEIQAQASMDLGFTVRGQALGYGAMFGKMLNQNDQYEVAEGYYNDMDVMWPAGVWQPIDTQRIRDWDKVTDLSKTGRLTPESNPGQGDAPFRHLWVDENGNYVEGPSRYVTMVPGWHNADSLGYNPDDTGRAIESWAELFSEDFKGAVALLNVPQIGVMDAALGVEGLGAYQFKDKGNMTREEIDFLIDFLIAKKQEGHFRAFWETFGQSVNLMVSGEVVLESMWSPAVTAIKAEGVRCVYASPKEGMRGWHGGCSISAKVTGKALDQAYDYINWWLDGWGGAFVARQGYYMSVPENVKKHLEPEEWDFWYEGKPAAKELPRSLRHHHRREGRGSRRRLVLEPLQQHRGMELADGRERLSRQALDGVPERLRSHPAGPRLAPRAADLRRGFASDGRASCVLSHRPGGRGRDTLKWKESSRPGIGASSAPSRPHPRRSSRRRNGYAAKAGSRSDGSSRPAWRGSFCSWWCRSRASSCSASGLPPATG